MGVNQAEEQVPSRVVAGRYRLESVLGRGGMGVVWLAVDTLIERRVALKELRAPTGVAAGDEASFVERAMREARNAGRLNHPDVVGVYDVIAPSGDDDVIYIVMEYVQAPTLLEVLEQEGPLPAHRVAALGVGILDALMAAHTMGIVHRDIKPGNVLVRAGDRVKLTDFGIALAAEDTTRLTRSGVIGTHAYLAPECFDQGHAGPAADLWALGATLFHVIAGQAPFDRDTTTATLRAILFEDPPAPPCGPPLSEVISGLLTRPIDQRLTSDAARQMLQEVVAATPVGTTPPGEPPNPVGSGQSSWEAQATSVHSGPAPLPSPGPTAQPAAAPWGQTTQPGAPPSPYVTGQPFAAPTSPSPQPGYPGGQVSSPRWGAQPGHPGQTKSKNAALWIILGLGGVGALIVAVVLITGGGSSSSPEGAVRGMFEALVDGDCQQAGDFVTSNMEADLCSANPDDFDEEVLGVETISEDGDRAVVGATLGDGDGDRSDDFEIALDVVRVDGEWRVDDVNLTDAELPDAELPEVPGPDYEADRAEVVAGAQEFLDAVNGGDEATAVGMLCSDRSDSDDATQIAEAIAGDASLEIDPAAEVNLGNRVSLVGTVDGEPIINGSLTSRLEEDGCIALFHLAIPIQVPD